MIYFASDSERIKVGYTGRDVRKRIAQISAHLPRPLILIGCIPGTREAEHAIHDRLGAYRLRGEWFSDCAEVRSLIKNFILAAKEISEPVRKKFNGSIRLKSPEEFGAMWARLANLFWPDDAIGGLSKFSERPREEVAEWLNGRATPPELVRRAFAQRVVEYALS